MNEMEGKSRSGGSNSGGVVKNRSSSGCLVIKKNLDEGRGAGSSGNGKVYKSKKSKKRGRVDDEDSSDEDEGLLEYYGEKGGALGSGSAGYNDFEGIGRNDLMKEGGMRRNELDIYDFDEYDDLSDVEMMGARYFYEPDMGGGSEKRQFSPRVEMKSGSASGGGMEFESGSSKGDIIYKRRKSFHGSTSGSFYPGKRRYVMNNELPFSMGKERFGCSNEAIRLQGKNGVLKVRVKNKTEANDQRPVYRPMEGKRVIHRGQEITAKSIIIQRHSPYSERKLPKKPIKAGGIGKKPMDKRKSWLAKSSEESDEESEDDGSSAKLQSDSVKVRPPIKRGRKAGSLQSPEISESMKAREGKVKRGTGTEKQLLREKIKSMLIGAGWTIDYRPRRGRDYSDAVYVNPSGTAFWSIIKAYDAFQKQLEEEGKSLKGSDDSSSLAPIPEDTLSKLTRQTRKKIEKELKRKKRKESGAKNKRTNRKFDEVESDADSTGSGRRDKKLSSYMKCSVKPSKSPSIDAWRDISSSNIINQERSNILCSNSSSMFSHARESNKIGRCTLLVRNSKKGRDFGTDGFVPYTGKRNLLSWLIDSRTVELNEKVHYMNRRCTRVILEGWITRDGIHCGCCNKILTVTKFEIHAGSKLRQPFQSIYLSSGPSLMQCLVDTWNKQDESLRNGFNKIDVEGDDPDDDTCAICADGGNLICCDSCPSTFHQNCLDIQMLPPGNWHCPNCSCKFCDLSHLSKAVAVEDVLVTCSLCERKYHSSCVELDGSIVSNSALPFCGKTCHSLFEKLQKILGIKHELEEGLCWSLIHCSNLGSDNSVQSFSQRAEWNSKLAVAMSIMDECFLPITDRRSGINVIHNVLYNCGSNFTRLNYKGFYTAILEKSDEIISAASIRVHGTQFAEMPFIGTRHIYRRQGMCRQLFSAIESALRSLNVEKVIIPAISELMDTWTKVFGFSTLEISDKQEMKTMNMLVFPGTDMLQKKLLGFETGVDLLDAAHKAADVPDFTQTSDIDSSPGPSMAAVSQDGQMINVKSFNGCSSQDFPASLTNIDDNSNDKPVILGGGSQGTRDSPLHLDLILNVSAEGLDDHIAVSIMEKNGVTENALDNPAEKQELSADCKSAQKACKIDVEIMDIGFPRTDVSSSPTVVFATGGNDQSLSQETTSSSLPLEIKLDTVEDLKDHITSMSEEINATENALDKSAEKPEVPADHKLTQEACKTDTEKLGNSLPRDDIAQNDDSLAPNPESATGDAHKSISEECHIGIVTSNEATPEVQVVRSQETTNSPPLDCKLESSEDLKDRIISTSEGANVADCQQTQELYKTGPEITGNGFPRIDKAQKEKSDFDGEHLSTPETSHGDICSIEASPGFVVQRSQDTTFKESVEAFKVHNTSLTDIAEKSLDDAKKPKVSAKYEATQETCHDDVSSIEVPPVFVYEGSQNTTLKKSAEDLKDHNTSPTREDTDIANKPIDDAGKLEVSTEVEVTEKACMTDTEIIGCRSPVNEKIHCDDFVPPTSGSVAAGGHQSMEETSYDCTVIEKSSIASDNNGDTDETNVTGNVDACSDLAPQNVSDTIVLAASREPKSHVWQNDGVCSPLPEQLLILGDDGTRRSLKNDSRNNTIGAVEPMLDFCGSVSSPPVLEGHVKNEDSIIEEVADIQSISQCSTETASNLEVTPVSTSDSITEAVVLPVFENDKQSSKLLESK